MYNEQCAFTRTCKKVWQTRMLDLKKLIEGSAGSAEFDVTVEACDVSGDVVSGTARAYGSVTNHSGLLLLDGTLEPDLRAVCGRCGNEFDYTVPVALHAKITDKVADSADEDEFLIMSDYAVGIEELIRTTLVLELPTRFLCREDCKGLCPKCGCDLNNGECGCDLIEHDRQWDRLLDYFDEK